MTPKPYPKLKAASASSVASRFTPQPAAQALLQPEQTPAEYLDVLEQNQMGEDAVKTLAHGMPERESVWWASQSAGKVSDKLPAADVQAMKAAEAWVKNPSPTTQAGAAKAAASTDFQGPGAWAAQAAAWSQPSAATPAAAPATPTVTAPVASQNLTPHAVTGAVMLAAAIAAKPELAAPKLAAPSASPAGLTGPKLAVPGMKAPAAELPQLAQAPLTPAEQTKSYEALKPFIDLGKEVASGENTWPAV